MTVAVGIFAVALGLIASERVDRMKVALIGAALVLLTQTLDQEQAVEAIDFNTIGLLVGMMLMPATSGRRSTPRMLLTSSI